MKQAKKRILSILLVIVMVLGIIPMASMTVSADSGYNYTADSWYSLEMYLKAAGNVTITITGDITNTHDMGSEGHKTLEVYGNKIINLNGHKIECVDKTSNAIVGGEVVTVESEKTMFHVDGSSSLTINDSKGGGEIAFKGDHLKESKNYFHYAKRDVFSVDGTLTVNAGKITAGSQGKEYIYKGEEIESVWGSLYSDWSGNAQQVTWGTAANVNEGGKLIVNGGELYGRGIHVYQNTKTNKAVMGQRDEVVYIAKGGTASVNGGSFIALEGANVFAGDGVKDGLKVRVGKFELKKPSTIRFIYDKELYAEHYRDWGLAELVNASSIGSFNVPQSAYSQVYEKLIVKYDGKEYKGFSEISALNFDKEDYRNDLSVEFMPNNDPSIHDAELELHYGTKVYDNAQTQYEYFVGSADKLKLYCDFEEEYYLDYDSDLIYVWNVWVDDNTGKADHEFFTNNENYINPLVFMNADLTGKTVFVRAFAYEVGPDNSSVSHYTNTFKLSPVDKPMGYLEFTDQTPQMETGENTCTMEGGYTGYSYGYQFNHKPLPQELVDAGYSVERVYSIQSAGGYVIAPTKDNGTGIVRFSNIYAEAGIYTLRMSLRLVKDGETVDSIGNVFNLFVYENADTDHLSVIFTEDSKAQAGGFLQVDVEKMAEKSDEFTEALFNGEVYGQWYVNGSKIDGATDSRFDIPSDYAGKSIYVEVFYGDNSIESDNLLISEGNPLYYKNPDWGKTEEDIIKAVEYTLNSDGTYSADVIVDVDCFDGQIYYYDVEGLGYLYYDHNNKFHGGSVGGAITKPARDEIRFQIASDLQPGTQWRAKVYLAHDVYADYEIQGYSFSWINLTVPESAVTGILGDADEDTKVNIKDATAIQKHIAGLVTLTKTGQKIADVDGNTNVNIKDATAIQKHIAGMNTGYKIGESVS